MNILRQQKRPANHFKQTTEPILIKKFGKMEYDVPNKNPRRYGSISLKVEQLQRFAT